jgi:uncharacterized protein (DUF2141 family)
MRLLVLGILLFVGLLAAKPLSGQKLSIVIEGFRNEKGQVLLNIYTQAESFKKEEPKFVLSYPKTLVNNGIITIDSISLPAGTYGIALVDDENSNGKLDFRLIVPREGFSFSNYPFTHHRKPDFDSFSFEHTDSTLVRFEVYYF